VIQVMRDLMRDLSFDAGFDAENDKNEDKADRHQRCVRETDKQGASSSDAGKMRKMHMADRHQRERNR
jgi:hypothetical protein